MIDEQRSRRKFLLNTSILAVGGFSPMLSIAARNRLNSQVNSLVKRQRRAGIITSDERTAWSVYDFRTNQKLVAINEDRPMQAASMVKVFVALAYFYLNQQNPRKYYYTDKMKLLVKNMLVHSSNSATDHIIKYCGGPRNVQRLCQKATGNLFKQLSIVEYIPNNGRTYRNRASAHDYSRFLYALWNNRLPSSDEIRRVMALPNNDRIRTHTDLPRNLKIYDKTGSTGMLCGNMGIVQRSSKSKANSYTFIGIIEKSKRSKNYGQWIKTRGDAMREVSELIFENLS